MSGVALRIGGGTAEPTSSQRTAKMLAAAHALRDFCL